MRILYTNLFLSFLNEATSENSEKNVPNQFGMYKLGHFTVRSELNEFCTEPYLQQQVQWDISTHC